MTFRNVSPVELWQLHAATPDLAVIDVREVDEYAASHAPIGANQPLSAISRGELGPIEELRGRGPIYFLCRSGARSGRVCSLLQEQGFPDVVNVAGGMMAWEAAGLPVVRG